MQDKTTVSYYSVARDKSPSLAIAQQCFFCWLCSKHKEFFELFSQMFKSWKIVTFCLLVVLAQSFANSISIRLALCSALLISWPELFHICNYDDVWQNGGEAICFELSYWPKLWHLAISSLAFVGLFILSLFTRNTLVNNPTSLIFWSNYRG